MAGLNKVMIIGNLGRDPEIKYTGNNVPVANFTVATSETWKDKNTGEKKESTEWHRVVAWRHLAELAEKYLHKGSKVYLEGKIETRKWTDKDGADRYTTEIVARELQFLDSKQSAPNDDYRGGSPSGGDDDLPF